MAGESALIGDVDQEPDWIFGILFEGAFPLEMNTPHQFFFRYSALSSMHLQKQRVVDEGVADRARHHNNRIGLLSLPD
jgi:phosphatidylethanolamine-binding protein (PEBP) family uncharacterized protein